MVGCHGHREDVSQSSKYIVVVAQKQAPRLFHAKREDHAALCHLLWRDVPLFVRALLGVPPCSPFLFGFRRLFDFSSLFPGFFLLVDKICQKNI